MAVTETWLTDESSVIIGELTPPGYSFLNVPRIVSSTIQTLNYGGISLLYKLPLGMFFQHSGHTTTTFEHAYFTNMKREINTVVIYRPPPSPMNGFTTLQFLREFDGFISVLALNSHRLLIVGDFNLHIDAPSRSDVCQFMSSVSAVGFKQFVSSPTHRSGHILDLVLSRQDDNLVQSCSVNENLLSDHHVCCNLQISKPTYPDTVRTMRNFRNIDVPSFTKDIADAIEPCFHSSNLNQLISQFGTSVTGVLDRHAPLQTRHRKVRLRQPWYNADIHAARKMRRWSERMWRKSHLESHFAVFMDWRKHVNCLIEAAKRAYFAKELKNADTKSMFRTVGTLLNKDSKPRPSSDSSQSLANDFINFFTDKISTIRNNLESEAGPVLHMRNTGVIPALDFEIASCEKISQIISSLANKSCSLDVIPTWFLKANTDSFLPIITHIVNTSISTGSFPDSLKHAIVTPILKKPSFDINELANYRPVSNLPFLSKVIEKVIASRITTHG
ncbi:uncharacterized protein LOC119742706 [Patiria miniata]|uniref:Endonuclease/exonuclease/phosphatase domain-containing protein n=1 Tax=Patiria miniata TaxID=46514 RepID=A0A914BFV5_PATMI|nr:uncharacterized protein LOC119742706 [Patiria miniata]